MNDYSTALKDARIRKEQRFGVDDPQCVTCGNAEIGMLCQPRNACESILCRNCKGRNKTVTDKSRKQKMRRFEMAGYSKPMCVVCGESEVRILELDHVENAANSEFRVPLCSNHHAIKSQSAEVGPMAALRLRDSNRRALELQAAFEFGAAAIIGMIAFWDGANDQMPRAVFLGVLSAGLILWALWNVRADAHLVSRYGRDYGTMLPATPVLELPHPTASTP
ncbi:MAG TPA: hypothetical protein VGF98_09035 [Candidatus Tumulicola sp.]|jgi:hypothetical protein